MQLRGEWTISNQPPGNMEYECCAGVHLRLSATYTGVELNNVSACFTNWIVTFLNSLPSCLNKTLDHLSQEKKLVLLMLASILGVF